MELDIHHQPEVDEEMHHWLKIGGWPEEEHKMEKSNGHMECNLEDNGVYARQAVGTQGLVVESQQ